MYLTLWALALFIASVFAKGEVRVCKQNDTYPDCGWYGETHSACDGTLESDRPASRPYLIAHTVGKGEDTLDGVSDQCLKEYGHGCRWPYNAKGQQKGKLLYCAKAEEQQDT
ncbi:hypothetical protein BDV32DRAFT_149044 [Aspergillus pseudonomiae]|uniref:Uncharacterized protein n=1 Tax=Aspergillus pseudonomiae TaxID=1506151 RepID=A0A5N7D2I3_9EURO|nr:uncharacterized protein BDV37DRAFT_286496 [Aspergillus pseudonomiae]KAB8260883.1 hypothetical protein BDV32DRAFT_149044 [Aspergillus pseudonomiae]KAE8400622.1 hypothetical protein BDV37DRAFT_286496 [Aspergillus pseudonomiae]